MAPGECSGSALAGAVERDLRSAVGLVFLPTYSSWLNRIECEFAALRYFALNGTNHRSHGEQDDAIGAYVRWRTQHAGPVRDFAVGSKIRYPNYYRRLLDEVASSDRPVH